MAIKTPSSFAALEPIKTTVAPSNSTVAPARGKPPTKTEEIAPQLSPLNSVSENLPIPVSLPQPPMNLTSRWTALPLSSTVADRTKEKAIRFSISATEVSTVSNQSPSRPESGTGSPVYRQPAYRRATKPIYPASARSQRQQGVVILKLTVNSRGRTEKVELKTSSNYAGLDAAALRAARDWQFEPATVDQRPVTCEVEVPVRFQLVDLPASN